MNELKPVIVQDALTKEVLMLAYANKEAVDKSRETGFANYWSRSRQKLWKKGETSGNTQQIVEIREDCDKDAIMYLVNQKGVACHTGKYSCFYEGGQETPFTLVALEEVIAQRKKDKPENSYTAMLLQDEAKIYEKLEEECGEVIQAAKGEGRQRTIEEAGDLLYHLMVLLSSKDIDLGAVLRELKKRRKKVK